MDSVHPDTFFLHLEPGGHAGPHKHTHLSPVWSYTLTVPLLTAPQSPSHLIDS